MKDSARLNIFAQMGAEVVDHLRAEAALLLPMDVDGACKGKVKTNGKRQDKRSQRQGQGQG